MAQKSRREEAHDEDQSLIPAIKEREVSLAERLKETHEQSAARVLEAEASAARRVESARGDAARSTDARRRAEAERAEAEVVELRKSLEQRVGAVAAAAERNHERAVSALINAVRGESHA